MSLQSVETLHAETWPPRSAQASNGPLRSPEGMDLRALVAVLRQRRMTIAITMLSVMLLALTFLALSPQLYTASTQLLIDPRDQKVLQTEVRSVGIGIDTSLVESQLRLLSSEAVLRRVVVGENLDTDREFGAPNPDGLTAKFRRMLGLTTKIDDSDPVMRAVDALDRRVSVRRAEKTYVIEIRVSSRDPHKAARLADAMAQAYIDDQNEAARAVTRQATNELSARLGELRDNVRKAEDKAQAFRLANGIVAAKGTLVGEQQLSELNQRLVLARARQSEAEARYDQAQRVIRSGGDPGGLSDALASNVVQALRTQLAEISRREVDLSNSLGPRHPQVAAVRAQLANIRSLIGEELKRIAEAARSDRDAARANEQSLSRELDRLQAQSSATDEAKIKLRELEREVEASRSLYEAFLLRAKQTSEQETFTTNSARVIAPATVPDHPSYPPRLLIIGLAIFLGVGLGATLALLREHFDDTFRSGKDIARHIGLEMLAAVPLVAKDDRGTVLAANMPFLRRSKTKSLSDGRAFSAALYRLRDCLREERRHAKARTFLFTSAEAGEGKTTLAHNFAVTLASHGEKVLLIDGDLTRHALSRRMAPQAERGLAGVLNGNHALAEAVIKGQPDQPTLLAVAESENELRPTRAQWERLLNTALATYDVVLVDGAPAIAEASMRMIGDLVDRSVLVVRANETRRDSVEEALEALRLPLQKLAGVVLNMASAEVVKRYEPV